MASTAPAALAGGQAVRLDDDGRAELGRKSLGGNGLPEAAIAPGRDAVLRTQVLGEALRAFEDRGVGARAERFDVGRIEAVDQARGQGRFRSHHDEVDGVVSAVGDEPVEFHDADIDAGGGFGDAAVARRAGQEIANGRGAKRPAQGMLASARSDDQDPHDPSPTLAPRLVRGRPPCIIGAAGRKARPA